MTIEITPEENPTMVTCTERLCRTEDGRLVPEDNPAARWLYCVPGQQVPKAEADELGMTSYEEAGSDPGPAEEPEEKQAEEPANKMRKPAPNK